MSSILNLALSNSSILQSYQKHGIVRSRFLADQPYSDGISAPYTAKVVPATYGFGQQVSFPLPRSGKLRRMPVLIFNGTGTGTATARAVYPGLNSWTRIELVSKTDTIEVLTPEVVLRRWGELGDEFLTKAIAMTGAAAATDEVLVTGGVSAMCALPFSFCMGTKAQALPLDIMESLTIRVQFAAYSSIWVAGVTAATMSECFIRLNYDQLSPEDQNAYLTDAFGSDQKGTLYKQIASAQPENAGTAVTDPTTTSEVKCTIHSDGLFSKIHFWAHEATDSAGTHYDISQNTKVQLRVNGGTIFEMEVGALDMQRAPAISGGVEVYTIDLGDSGLDLYKGAGSYSGGLGSVGLGTIELTLVPTIAWTAGTYTCNVVSERLSILEIAATGESKNIARV
jgi:hypothetical protein